MEIRKLSKKYDNHVLFEDLSMEIQEGEIYGLMAPSGKGKTTLLRILSGLEKADSGELRGFEGKRISMVFQENRLCEFLTAWENVAIVQEHPMERERLQEILGQILPEEALEQKVKEFSGGMKRRTAMARALLCDSDLLLMDEPFTGLDEGTKEQVFQFLLKYRAGRTLIFSTHQEEELSWLQGKRISL